MKTAALIACMVFFLSLAAAEPDSLSTAPLPGGDQIALRGFSTSLGRTSYVSSAGEYASGDYDFWLGFGYNITRRLFLGIRIYTGAEGTSPFRTFPYSGKFSLGGASVNVAWRFPVDRRFQFFTEGGFQLSTILAAYGNAAGGSSGYNGRAGQLSFGGEYFLHDSFSLHGEVLYRHRHYIDVIVDGENKGNRATFMDNDYGVGIGCNLYFDLLP